VRKSLILLVGVALAAAACSADPPDAAPRPGVTTTTTAAGEGGDGPDVVTIDGTDLRLISSLRGFDECDSLLAHLRTEGSARVGAWGFEEGGWYGPFVDDVGGAEVAADGATATTTAAAEAPAADRAASGADEPGSATGSGSDLVEGEGFSGTNVQELGVDEADIVKTDGERIYVVSANQLVVVDAATATELGRTEIAQGYSPELFLGGGDVLLVTRGDSGAVPFGRGAGVVADSIRPGYVDPATIIQSIDVSGGTPRVRETLRVEGDYVTARSVDGIARIVLQANPQWAFPFVYPQSEAGEERAAEANQEAVAASTLDDWLPHFVLEDAGGAKVAEGILPDCRRVDAPTEFSGFGVVSVLSVPLAGPIDTGNVTSVLAPGDVVYASPDSLYVATTTWLDPQIAENEQDWEAAWAARRVNIHRFDISTPDAAYAASGSVPGEIRDQFSLSEYDGYLRVVTTSGEPWNQTSESQVRVLQENGTELVEVGSVGDIGNGEAVQSVRFAGPVGYVVTFQQVDPFYTIDLADPAHPTIAGELKIPGFSSYLHPIGDGLVLGVGSAATEQGSVTGAKVSLFDVSDLADPQEVATWTAPDGWNDVGWEHRSFLWWEPLQLAVIPVQVWNENWAGAVVLRVADGQITEVGRIDHIDPDAQADGTTECRTVTPEEVGADGDPGQFNNDIQWLTTDPSALLLVCGAQQADAAAGYQCYEEPYYTEQAEAAGLQLAEGDRLVYCYRNPQQNPISRSLVIGEDLWTLSYPYGFDPSQGARLQRNDLASLARESVVQL
jgi:Beta propeller domain